MKTFSLILFTGLLATSLQAGPDWALTFSDEFDTPANTSPDKSKWVFDTGGHGFGNAQLEFDTDRVENCATDGKGNLVIQAIKEDYKGMGYTSARIKTEKLFSQTYGRFEARIKMPYGKGIWPAFWLLGENYSTLSWPACGEIDIVEYLGQEKNIIHGTVHGPGYSGAEGKGKEAKIKKGNVEDKFRVYAVEWEPYEIRWYLDGKQFHKITPKTLDGATWVFDTPFFVILNLAVGGNWPGSPDETTVFPQRMLVDYVRVYKDKNLKIPKDYVRPGKPLTTPVPLKSYEGDRVHAIPGLIQAEDFITYKDDDAVNHGGGYRETGVDITGLGDGSGGSKVGWSNPGEWLEYDVEVNETRTYKLQARVGAAGRSGRFHFSVDGKRVSKTRSVPDTKAWGKFKIVKTKIKLPKGKYRLRLEMEKGKGPGAGDYDWFSIQ